MFSQLSTNQPTNQPTCPSEIYLNLISVALSLNNFQNLRVVNNFEVVID
jgi:hypothetical protein